MLYSFIQLIDWPYNFPGSIYPGKGYNSYEDNPEYGYADEERVDGGIYPIRTLSYKDIPPISVEPAFFGIQGGLHRGKADNRVCTPMSIVLCRSPSRLGNRYAAEKLRVYVAAAKGKDRAHDYCPRRINKVCITCVLNPHISYKFKELVHPVFNHHRANCLSITSGMAAIHYRGGYVH